MESTIILLPSAGLIAGIALGFVARRNFFCTLSSLEQHWYASNSNGLRTWVLAATVAAILTQLSIGFALIDVSDSIYLTTNFAWLGAVVGGIAFGLGMAFVGTCGFGALVRLGGGSLKSLVAVLILGISALSAQRGLLGLGRTEFFDNFQIDLAFAGSQAVPDIVSALVGSNVAMPVTVSLLAISLFWIFSDATYREDRKSIFTGTSIGAIVTFGWFATIYFSKYSFDNIQIESASFVAPVGDTILQFTAFTGSTPDYGIGVVIGTIIGSAIAARSADNIRWEACDDARELSRHIFGATLMGAGGVLALGCTVGQGVSAASLLAISVPVTMLSIGLGARMGLSYLLEGSFVSALKR
jgi:hypothetical protein